MISIIQAKRYCMEDISKIENYDKAIADTTQVWCIHHKDEVKVLPSGITILRSSKDLKENGRYYNCPANELIFLTESEHKILHNTHRSEETKQKISDSHKGKSCSVFGKAFKEHYGITYIDNIKLYKKEYSFYKKHGKFSWEA